MKYSYKNESHLQFPPLYWIPLTIRRLSIIILTAALFLAFVPGLSSVKAQSSVVINEIFYNPNGQAEGHEFVELYNPSSSRVDISNWRITSGIESEFGANTSIAAGGYLVIAQNANDFNAAFGQTANALFRGGLSNSTDRIELRNAANVIVDTVTYSDATPWPASADGDGHSLQLISATADNDVASSWGAQLPTPKGNNSGAIIQALSPVAAVGRGLYTSSFTESLSTATANGEIRYTLDGSRPTTSSSLYNGPIPISPNSRGLVTLRAITVKSGYAPSAEMSATYLFPNQLTDDPGLDQLPTISVQTDDRSMPICEYVIPTDCAKERASIEYIEPNTSDPNSGQGFGLTAGIAVFGSSSVTFPKTSFRLYFDSEWGLNDLEYPVFDGYGQGTIEPVTKFDRLELRAQSWDGPYDLVIRDNYGPDFYVSDRWWKDTILDLGSLSPHGRYANVFMNGRYHGVYDLRERFDPDWFASYGEGNKEEYVSLKEDLYADQTFLYQGSLSVWESIKNASSYSQVKELINAKALIHHELVDSLTDNTNNRGEREYRIIGAADPAHADDFILMYNDPDQAFGGGSSWFRWAPAGPSEHVFGLVDKFKADPEFRQEALDQTAFAFCGNGPLTVQASLNRLNEWAAEVSIAMDADIARWVPNDFYSAIDIAREAITTGMPQLKAGWQDEGLFDGCDRRPTVDMLPNHVSLTNASVRLAIQAVDPDGDSINYSSSTLPPGLAINSNSGVITGVPTTSGIYTVQVRVGDSNGKWGNHTFEWEILAASGQTSPLILNEYNAVDLDADSGFAGADPAFPNDPRIGGDWLELVLVDENVDLRGWTIELWDRDRNSQKLKRTEAFVLTNNPLFNILKAGTIVTIAEDVPDDISYNPAMLDWSITLQSNNNVNGQYITAISQENFDSNRHNFRILIRNAAGQIVGPFMGETEAWSAVNGNVSAKEVMALCVPPLSTIDAITDYADEGMTSTFGAPNICNGIEQDFSAYHPAAILGDVNCDQEVNVIDSLYIMQLEVLMRSNVSTCPLADITSELNADVGDTNADNATNVIDALLIMQCVVNITNIFCP